MAFFTSAVGVQALAWQEMDPLDDVAADGE